MLEIFQKLLEALGLLVIISPAIWLVAKALSKRALDEVFAKRLEDFKGEKLRELSSFKAELDKISNKSRFIQQHRIQILPEIWANIAELKHSINRASKFFRSYPDLDSMNDEEFEEYIKSQEWSPSTERYIKNANVKNSALHKIRVSEDINAAIEPLSKLSRSVDANRFTIEDILEDHFDKIITSANNVLIDLRLNNEEKGSVKAREIRDEVKNLESLIAQAVISSKNAIGLPLA